MKTRLIISALGLAGLLVACSSEELVSPGVADQDAPIILRATVDQVVDGSKSSTDNENTPLEGDFVFTYNVDGTNKYLIKTGWGLLCKFENGVAHPNLDGVPLTWGDLSTYNFTLDNVKIVCDKNCSEGEHQDVSYQGDMSRHSANTSGGLQYIRIGYGNEGNNPYEAGPYKEFGTNDIVSGIINNTSLPNPDSETKERILSFELKHLMAQFALDLQAEGDLLKDKKVEVRITNIFPRPLYFYRRQQSIRSLNADTDKAIEHKDVILYEGMISEKEQVPIWIFPPQTFSRESGNQSKLIIKVGNDTYSNYLPQTMLTTDENNNNVLVSFELKSGYKLVLKVKLSKEDEPTLTYLGARLVNWSLKGSNSVGVYQNGIYSEADYKELVEAYNNPFAANRDKILAKYGSKGKDGKWTFELFEDLFATDNEYLRFNDGLFYFHFNGHDFAGCKNLGNDGKGKELLLRGKEANL